jgi:hypothetical protein
MSLQPLQMRLDLVVHPVETRVFRDNRKGTTSTNEETMIEASLIGDDGRKLSEIRTLKTWSRWIELIDAHPEIRPGLFVLARTAATGTNVCS